MKNIFCHNKMKTLLFISITTAFFIVTLIIIKYCSKEVSVSNDQPCVSRELNDCIAGYINKIDPRFIDEAKPFYSVFFFDHNGRKGFTIWSSVYFPDSAYFTCKVRHYALNILDRNVVIVCSENSRVNKRLFTPCKKEIEYVAIVRSKDMAITYDGSIFPQTYYYSIVNSTMKIVKSDTSYIDFLGENIIRFEEYLKKEKKK